MTRPSGRACAARKALAEDFAGIRPARAGWMAAALRAALPLDAGRARRGSRPRSSAPASTSAYGATATGLCVWGTTRDVPRLCFVLEVVAPGLLVIKYRRGRETGKFVNVAVLEGDTSRSSTSAARSLPDCPELLTSCSASARRRPRTRLRQRARAARRVDARARPRRRAARRPARHRTRGASRS